MFGLCVLAATSAGAEPRDATIRQQIDAAISEQFLAGHFREAEAALLEAIRGCDGQCSRRSLARAWLYVGVVRDGGLGDRDGAKRAFDVAHRLDGRLRLDEPLASAEAVADFAEMSGGRASGLRCTPSLRTVQTRRPIPIECAAENDVARLELRWADPSGRWHDTPFSPQNGAFRVAIPCNATDAEGTLLLYVRALDANDDLVDGWGTREEPIEIELTEADQSEDPAYPGEDPPGRCAPPDPPCLYDPRCDHPKRRRAPKRKLGCRADAECRSDFTCVKKSCRPRPRTRPPPKDHGPPRRSWLGLHLALDLVPLSGDDVCSPRGQRTSGYTCVDSYGARYAGEPQPGSVEPISGHLAGGTTQLLASFTQHTGSHLALTGRGGVVIGGPDALGLHLDARGEYFFDEHAFAKPGLRPYVALGGGVARVEAKAHVRLVDCSASSARADCAQSSDPDAGQALDLDAWRRLGPAFVGVGGGAVWAFRRDRGLRFELTALYLLPKAGFALQPSLGYVFGL